jgi:hypothetical protein
MISMNITNRPRPTRTKICEQGADLIPVALAAEDQAHDGDRDEHRQGRDQGHGLDHARIGGQGNADFPGEGLAVGGHGWLT